MLGFQTTLSALGFALDGADAVRFATAPTVAFTLRVTSDKPVRSLALNAQIRIAPARRRYSTRIVLTAAHPGHSPSASSTPGRSQ